MLTKRVTREQGLADAYAFCRSVALGRNENFTVASWLLPRPLRRHMYAVYAYCRGVDDLGDEAEGDRAALLDEWERDLRSCYDDSPSDIRFVALQHTIRRFDIPLEDIERFGYNERELLEREYNVSFRRLIRFQVGRTRELFQQGLGLLPLVSGWLRFDLRLFSLGGLAVLDAIERANYDVRTTRPEISGLQKAALAVRGLLPLPIRAVR